MEWCGWWPLFNFVPTTFEMLSVAGRVDTVLGMNHDRDSLGIEVGKEIIDRSVGRKCFAPRGLHQRNRRRRMLYRRISQHFANEYPVKHILGETRRPGERYLPVQISATLNPLLKCLYSFPIPANHVANMSTIIRTISRNPQQAMSDFRPAAGYVIAELNVQQSDLPVDQQVSAVEMAKKRGIGITEDQRPLRNRLDRRDLKDLLDNPTTYRWRPHAEPIAPANG